MDYKTQVEMMVKHCDEQESGEAFSELIESFMIGIASMMAGHVSDHDKMHEGIELFSKALHELACHTHNHLAGNDSILANWTPERRHD